jgi:hypothetical protein
VVETLAKAFLASVISGLVPTAAEDRLTFRRNSHPSFAAASDGRTIAI